MMNPGSRTPYPSVGFIHGAQQAQQDQQRQYANYQAQQRLAMGEDRLQLAQQKFLDALDDEREATARQQWEDFQDDFTKMEDLLAGDASPSRIKMHQMYGKSRHRDRWQQFYPDQGIQQRVDEMKSRVKLRQMTTGEKIADLEDETATRARQKNLFKYTGQVGEIIDPENLNQSYVKLRGLRQQMIADGYDDKTVDSVYNDASTMIKDMLNLDTKDRARIKSEYGMWRQFLLTNATGKAEPKGANPFAALGGFTVGEKQQPWFNKFSIEGLAKITAGGTAEQLMVEYAKNHGDIIKLPAQVPYATAPLDLPASSQPSTDYGVREGLTNPHPFRVEQPTDQKGSAPKAKQKEYDIEMGPDGKPYIYNEQTGKWEPVPAEGYEKFDERHTPDFEEILQQTEGRGKFGKLIEKYRP